MKDLNSIFNIESTQETSNDIMKVSETFNTNKELDQEDDYQLARSTMRSLLIKGEDTLNEISNLAKNSEHPRTYEVTGQMIKTLSDVAKDLIGLQKQVKELQVNQDVPKIGTQNNVVFAGSTHELMKILGNKDDNNTIDQ
jgi:hypothetical protein